MVDLAAPLVLAIAALTGLVAALRVIRIRAPARAAAASGRERERRAHELGWAYDETAFGGTLFTFRGEAQGIKWKARYRAEPGAPAPRHALMWMTRSVQGSATELHIVGRKRHGE